MISGLVAYQAAIRVFSSALTKRRIFSGTIFALILLAAMGRPLMAQVSNAAPATDPTFGQYLADHQDDLAPFFEANAGDFFRLAVPLVIGMLGWIALCTMLVGWVVDVLMGRGFAFFFAPAYAEIKRAFIYATGRLFLSFVYTILLGIAIVFSLKLTYAAPVMSIAVILLLLVAFAAQIVWILYLYRPPFLVSVSFYIAIVLIHSIVGFLIAKPLIGSHASKVATDFVDRVVTARLQVEVDGAKSDLAVAAADRDSVKGKVTDLQNQIAQSQQDQEQLQKEIEEKKNSDIYLFSRIVQAHARGELEAARDQLTAFLAQFPNSSLNALARAQLAQVNDQITNDAAKKKQEAADAERAAAEARADLLARAAKGQVTLSEIRQVLIGKSRAQVSDLLGEPAETGPDSWGYTRAMILNPLTNEHHGLTVYFSEGQVQSVDYDKNGGPQ
jgi:hypothetical protein